MLYETNNQCFYIFFNENKYFQHDFKLFYVTDRHVLLQLPGMKMKDTMESLLVYPNDDIPVAIITERYKKLIDLYEVI